MQIVDLQFGDGGVAGVNILPLFDQGLGKLLAPGLLQLLNLGQSVLDLIGVGQSLALFQFLVQSAQALVHAVHLARVPA